MTTRFAAAVVVIVASTISVGSNHAALAATSEQSVFDNTPSGPLNTDVFITQSYGWQFVPNEDADITSITIWQSGTPNTSSVAIHEKNNDGTIGASLGTFTFDSSPSDNTPVASYNGIDYFAFTYRGSATVSGVNSYWLVVTGGSTATGFIGTNEPNFRYAPGTPGRAVLTGNNYYRGDTSRYFYAPTSFIYVLRRAAPNTASGNQAPAVVQSLAFALPADMTCGNANSVESTDLWVQLPSSSECSITGSAERSQAPQLLGWATTPDFPVALAQRQIDNGWGAYELFDDSGDIAAVFIPAGGFAALTADTQLFPIMSG